MSSESIMSKQVVFDEINLSTLSDDNVLFFIRIRGKDSYFKNVYTQKFLNIFDAVNDYRCISEYKKDADVHIDLNGIGRSHLHEQELALFNELVDVNETIIRCRALRESVYVDARKMMNRAFLFFTDFYQHNSALKVIVTGAIDNYVMDIMVKVGRHYGITFLGVTDSFMSPAYKLITTKGENSQFSVVDDHEAEQIFHKIQNTSVSPIVPSFKKSVLHACYDVGSYYYRFFVRYVWKHLVLGRLEYEYKYAPKLHKFYSPWQLLGLRYLKNMAKFEFRSDKKYAYLPLHYFPEATVDYWFDSLDDADYFSSVMRAVTQLKSKGYEVIIKEHPSFYLAREPSFYKDLESAGAYVFTPFTSTKEVFKKVDLIVVWNGSTGIEAVVEHKPVVKVTNSYYGDGLIPDLDDVADVTIPDDRLGLHIVKKVLQSSFKTV